MSLALLTYLSHRSEPEIARFSFDLGTSRYYQFQIGKGTRRDLHGFSGLAQVKYSSPIFGPVSESSMGRGTFEFPGSQFSRKHPAIQLISYRTKNGKGKAVSDVHNVFSDIQSLASLSHPFSRETGLISSTIHSLNMQQGTENIAYSYQESTFSSAMFFSALKKLIPKVLPVVKNIVAKAAPVAKQVGGKVLADMANPSAENGGSGVTAALMPALGGILQQIGQNANGTPGKTGMTGTIAAQIGNLLADPNTAQMVSEIAKMVVPPQSPEGATVQAELAQATSLARDPQYPQYSVASSVPPQVIAALAPLMEKLADPQVLAALGESGTKLVNAIGSNQIKLADTVGNHAQKAIGVGAGLIKDFFGLAVEDDEKMVFEPSNIDHNTTQLLMNMQLEDPIVVSQSMRRVKPDRDLFQYPNQMRDFRRVSSVLITPTDMEGLILNGRPRIVFSPNQDVRIPLSLETPQPIPKAIVRVCLKQAENSKVLLKKVLKLTKVAAGPLAQTASFSRAELAQLPPNEDYLLSIRFIFRDHKGQRLGTSHTEVITLLGAYSYDRMEDVSEPIPLNNVETHRNFWHKVWAGKLTKKTTRVEIDGKYFFAIEADREVNGRMPTDTRFEKGRFKDASGKLKSGLIVSPFVLNGLIPQISDYPVLNQTELKALLTPDFLTEFGRKGRFSVQFASDTPKEAHLWVYPELKMKRIFLQKAGEISPNGRVLNLEEQEVYFPVPIAIHAVGATTL